MNIEIANRLVKLRKDKKLSQEALASELGISRQAVSKWERAESSPDTDNLIMLANLYGLSLDELLSTDQEKFESGETYEGGAKEESKCEEDKDFIHISLKEGIHVKEKNGDEVHVGWKGIHVTEGNKDKTEEVHIDQNGIFVDGHQYNRNDYQKDFPVAILVFVAYIILGVQYDAWHPGWLIFGFVPIFHTLISAIKHRDISYFAYPVVVLMYIGYCGFVDGSWYPQWLSILSIPVYYSVFGYLSYLFKRKEKKES